MTIVGSGFGYLPNLPQTVAGSSTEPFPYLNIHNDNNSGRHNTWDSSTNPACQVYIANWTDTSISLVVNLQTQRQNLYESDFQPSAYLSPLSDISPESFLAVLQTSTTGCPVAYNTNSHEGDKLSFTVTNPQTGVTLDPPFPATIWPTGSTPK